MSERTFVQGDTSPDLTAILHDENDTEIPINLTGATVKMQMRKADDLRFTINAAAEVVDAETGSVRYQWGANDLAVPGEYLVQWEITHAGGRIQTTQPPNTITVRRQ